MPEKLMESLGLAEGDVIEITGKRSTAARAIRPYGEDEGIDIIRQWVRHPAGVRTCGDHDPVAARLRRLPPANFQHASGVPWSLALQRSLR